MNPDDTVEEQNAAFEGHEIASGRLKEEEAFKEETRNQNSSEKKRNVGEKDSDSRFKLCNGREVGSFSLI